MTPLVLFHGWGHTSQVWEPFRHLLGTPAQAPTLQAPATSLLEWADAIAPSIAPQSKVIGWSLGAMLALALAARHPQRVKQLVLIAATPRFVQAADWPHGIDTATLQGFRQGLLSAPARTQQRFVALQVLGDNQRKGVADTLQGSLADGAADTTPLLHGLRMLAESDLRPHVPSPSLRCLLIHGDQDALIPPAAARVLSEAWPASQLHIVAGASHAPFLSQPDAVARKIQDFFHDG